MFLIRITLILLLFLLLPDLYIYWIHIRRHTRKKLWQITYWLPTIVILTACILYFRDANALAHHATAIGRLAIIIMLFSLPKTLFMLCSLIGQTVHWIIRPLPRWPFTLCGLILGTVCLAGGLYGALWGTTKWEVKEIDYHNPRLPKGFEGYRIVQLSDLHLGSWEHNPTAIEQVVETVNALKPNLIVFTGDLVNQQGHETDPFIHILRKLSAPDGVYSILGNHDYGTYYHWENDNQEKENLQYLKDQQARMGWRLLNNEHVILHHNGDSIALIGVENDGEPPFSQHADLPNAIQGSEDMFRILLSHNPTHWKREVLPNTDIELMLSGHTHAMQLELFGRSPASLKYPEWSGMYHNNGQSLYVNVGLGYVGLPFRFGAWPEITVFNLYE